MKLNLRLLLTSTIVLLVALGTLATSPYAAEAQLPGDLAVTKTGPATIGAGGLITYTITISNVGMGPRELITFTDSLPANTTFVSWTQTSGPTFILTQVGAPVTSVQAQRTLMLNGGESAVFSLQVQLNAGVTNGTVILNPGPAGNLCQVASTSTAFNETNLANNTCIFTTLVVIPPTPVPSTPIPPTPTATPVPPAVLPVIPQVFQHPVGGIFNGTRNNTPTPVRPAAVAPAATMPVVRPPSTGDSGLADNGTSSAVYGLAIIGALSVVSFGAARMRAVRQK